MRSVMQGVPTYHHSLNSRLFLRAGLWLDGGIKQRKPHAAAPFAPDIRVMIRNAQGKYLAQDDHGLFFTQDRSVALVFSYLADDVAAQLSALEAAQGVALAAEPVPPEEIYERCDRCHDLFMPWMIYFDGGQFVCVECRKGRLKAKG
jgi:hypothetical protein